MGNERMLLIRLSAMGDVIHALPAVASLKNSFPQAKIAWLIKPRWAPLLEGNPAVDKIVPFVRTLGGIRDAVKRLRRERFDVAVDLQGLVQSALLARASGARRVVGLDRTEARESLAAMFYSTRVRTTQAHRVDQCLELAEAAGATKLVRTFFVPQGRAEGSLPEGRFVLACPMAGWGAKQWPLEYYSEVAAGLEVPLVVNGPPEALAQLGAIRGATVHLSGLSGLIDATRRASAVIGVDSGPLHLAAALSKPGVAIYGPTDPASHGPYGGSIRVLRWHGAPTNYKRGSIEDASMRAIKPRAVLEALEEIAA